MANLTLAIDDALLQRAREMALGRTVEARSRRLEALAQFEAVASGSHSASRQPWSRESLHERG